MHSSPSRWPRSWTRSPQDLRPRLVETGATLDVGDLPEVRGDARQLRRLLQNLVANAVKFRGPTRPGSPSSAREGAEQWVVTVADNGIGVPAADHDRIFGMFTRAHRDHDGTGIGLAVCRRVAEAHGGRIWVEPADGGGSAFRFTLPQLDRRLRPASPQRLDASRPSADSHG